MNQTNKIIKYLAIAFGVFLIFNIVSVFMHVFISISNIDNIYVIKFLFIKCIFHSESKLTNCKLYRQITYICYNYTRKW